jgi:UDP-glucose 4-epimerase
MVVPRFVEAALKNKPLTIYGSGKQTRCFGHVKDVVGAILILDKCAEAAGKPVNIGVNQEISIIELASKVIELTKSSSKICYQSYESAYIIGFEDMERRVPDNKLLRQLTGWGPSKDIDQIVIDVADYLRGFNASN